MPDENRFSGLGDVVETEDTESAAAGDVDGGGEADDGTSDEAGGPAFEFEATTAKSVYVRPETLSVLDDAEFEVESFLRRDHGVRDLTGREFHDALVRVAAEHSEDVAAAVLAARDGEDGEGNERE